MLTYVIKQFAKKRNCLYFFLQNGLNYDLR